MRFRLNGWHRLWVVVSVLWVALFFFIFAPQIYRIYSPKQHKVAPTQEQLHELLDIMEQAKTEKDQETYDLASQAYRRASAGPVMVIFSSAQSATEVTDIVRTKITPAIIAGKLIPNPYDAYVQDKARPAILRFVILTLGPPLGLLLLGWSIAWIRRGFRVP